MNTMTAAFEKAGVAKETLRELVTRALVAKMPSAALWLMLQKDKRAADAAMTIVLRTYAPNVSLPSAAAPVEQETRRARKLRITKISRQAVQRIAETALDAYRLIDGRRLKAIAWRELPRIAARSEKDAALIRKLLKRYRVTDPKASVAQVVSATIFDSILKETSQ